MDYYFLASQFNIFAVNKVHAITQLLVSYFDILKVQQTYKWKVERVSDGQHHNLLINYAASPLKSEFKCILDVVYDLISSTRTLLIKICLSASCYLFDWLCWFNSFILITEYGDVTDIYNW